MMPPIGTPSTGAAIADVGTLALELLPKFLEDLGKETPIEVAIEAVVDGLQILSAGLVSIAQGTSVDVAKRAMQDKLLDRLETFKTGDPPLPL